MARGIAEKAFTPRQLVAAFQSHVDAIDEVDATRAALAAAVARERELARRMTELTRYVKMAVEARFGLSHKIYADFGWEVPKRPGPKTVEAKLEGRRKRATRERRAGRWESGSASGSRGGG
jgi:hypothetical protein